ncbi:MAG: adenine phosphoribosyltransferase, partial [Litorilinea sp.]
MSYDGRIHRVSINGLTRELPLFAVAPQVKIAIFNMLGDTEIVEAAADALAALMPAAAQVLIVPEV